MAIKILHLIDSAGFYGAEAVLLTLCSEQLRRGHAAEVVSIGSPNCGDKALEQEAERRGVRVHRLRMADGPNPFGARNLLKLARRERADILHSHGYKANILLGFIPKPLRGVPLISTVHGYTDIRGLSRLRLYRWLDVRALQHCDRVVVVHAGMLTGPLLQLDPRRVRIIENGVPERESSTGFDQTDRDIVDFCGRGGVIIGAVGRLSPEKGIDRLIEAFGRLIQSGIDARLLILGEGGERSSLERLVARHGLGDRVLMPGFANSQRHLAKFDVFVLPSLTEGLPICLLEAMRAGLPIVATRVGGVPAVLAEGDGGMLVEPGDVDALTRAVGRMLSDRTLAKRLSQISQSNVKKFSSERMADRYLDVYTEMSVTDPHHADTTTAPPDTTRRSQPVARQRKEFLH